MPDSRILEGRLPKQTQRTDIPGDTTPPHNVAGAGYQGRSPCLVRLACDNRIVSHPGGR
jgi:hypothetical protein